MIGGTDIALEPTVIYGWRKFCNKIYQATKYVLLNLPSDFQPPESCGITGSESLPESWILHSLETATKDVDRLLTARNFSKATDVIYRYWLSELCDVYIENSKPTIRDGTDAEKLSTFNTLYTAIEGGLTMLHPFMPYLTEELWQRIPRRHGDKTPSITIAKYPVYGDKMLNPEAAAKYGIALSISSGIRSFLGEKASSYEGTVSIECLSTLSDIQLKAIKALIGKGITLVTLTKPPSAKCRSSTIPDVATVYIESEVEEQIAGLEVA
jgi:valyl-tRNA synthetase